MGDANRLNRASSLVINSFQSLKFCVTDEGLVNYKALLQERLSLVASLKYMAVADTKAMNAKTLKCFYLNAYNYMVIAGIVQILDSTNGSAFHGHGNNEQRVKFQVSRSFIVGRKELTIAKVEDLLRAYKDPRLFLCINSGTFSQPRVPADPFEAPRLDSQINAKVAQFINSEGGAVLKKNKLYVSQVFKWYKADFKAEGALKLVIKYWKNDTKISSGTKLRHQKFNWSLNDTSKTGLDTTHLVFTATDDTTTDSKNYTPRDDLEASGDVFLHPPKGRDHKEKQRRKKRHSGGSKRSKRSSSSVEVIAQEIEEAPPYHALEIVDELIQFDCDTLFAQVDVDDANFTRKEEDTNTKPKSTWNETKATNPFLEYAKGHPVQFSGRFMRRKTINLRKPDSSNANATSPRNPTGPSRATGPAL